MFPYPAVNVSDKGLNRKKQKRERKDKTPPQNKHLTRKNTNLQSRLKLQTLKAILITQMNGFFQFSNEFFFNGTLTK